MWSEMELVDSQSYYYNRTQMGPLQSQGSTKDGHDALLYITVVLAIYAVSIIILMVKYIRRERQEAVYDNYYVEFVKRDRFRMDGNFSKIVMEKFPSNSTYYGSDRHLTPV